ncbi:MAG: hypothetical protein ACJ8R9_02785 [Steroidobacteraceae bacterium]
MRLNRPVLSIVALLAVIPAIAQAWDGVVSGTISAVEVNSLAYPLRVYITNGPSAFCGGSANNWGYLTVSETNYNATVAALLSAKATGSTVDLYMTRDASGYCHIEDLFAH